MFKKVLVPLDFSDCSKNALKNAIIVVQKTGAELILLHAYHVPVPHMEAASASVITPLMEGYEENVKEDFENLANSFPELKGLPYRTSIEQGFATDAIMALMEAEPFDLVVMGTKGSSGIMETILGSITAAIIQESKVPVMAVPLEASIHELDTMVLACDYKHMENYDELLKPLVTLAEVFESKVDVLNVIRQEHQDSKSRGTSVIDHCLENLSHSYHYASDDDIEKGIMDFIESQGIDLLALMPRKHNLIERIFQTSITKKLTFHTTIPLLTLPEKN